MLPSSDGVHLDTVRLVVKRNLSHKAETFEGEKLVRELTSLTHCRLDRESLTSVPRLNFLPCLTNLYLQCNQVSEIPDLSYLSLLRFLTLAENRLSKVTGLKYLERLGLLDLTDNQIDHLDSAELPKSLIILNISGNPCTTSLGFRDDIISNLPYLKSLDGEAVTVQSSSDEEDEDSAPEDIDNLDSREKAGKCAQLDNMEKVEDGYFDDLKSDMVECFAKFSLALSENEKDLKIDYDEFNSNLPSPSTLEGDPMWSAISEQELSNLEREAADITDLPRLNSAKRLTPRPPSGTRSKNRARTKHPLKNEATVTHVRTPGARPFRRVVK